MNTEDFCRRCRDEKRLPPLEVWGLCEAHFKNATHNFQEALFNTPCVKCHQHSLLKLSVCVGCAEAMGVEGLGTDKSRKG